jgi:tetratricopeptide (TPR) repeat protein
MQGLWKVALFCICWSFVYPFSTVQAKIRQAGIAHARHVPPARSGLAAERGAELSRQAQSYWAKGEYAQAEILWQRALVIQEKTLGLHHPDVVTTLYSLAGLYQERGEYTQAETLWQRALAIQEQALGPEHPNVAATLHSLAGLYLAKGEYSRVEPLLQRTLAIEEQTLGLEDPQVDETPPRC